MSSSIYKSINRIPYQAIAKDDIQPYFLFLTLCATSVNEGPFYFKTLPQPSISKMRTFLILSALCLFVCKANILLTTSDDYKSKAQDLVSSCKSYYILIIVSKIANPDFKVVNAVGNVASIALNQPLDKEALGLWISRLGSSLKDAESPSKYRELESKADELKQLDPVTGKFGDGNGSNSNNLPTSPSQSADMSQTSNTVAVPTLVNGNTFVTAINVGTATSTSTGTVQTASTKPNGLPFQPRPADSSSVNHFSVLGSLILLLF